MDTPTQQYSKGVLVQAKRSGRIAKTCGAVKKQELNIQCQKMLAKLGRFYIRLGEDRSMRGGRRIIGMGSTSYDLYRICNWTSYRFFLEYFRSPIGDPRISSSFVEDLPPPVELIIRAEGRLDEESASPGPFRPIRRR